MKILSVNINPLVEIYSSLNLLSMTKVNELNKMKMFTFIKFIYIIFILYNILRNKAYLAQNDSNHLFLPIKYFLFSSTSLGVCATGFWFSRVTRGSLFQACVLSWDHVLLHDKNIALLLLYVIPVLRFTFPSPLWILMWN